MRPLTVLTALLVVVALYLFTFEREAVRRFAGLTPAAAPEASRSAEAPATPEAITTAGAQNGAAEAVAVIAIHSRARPIERTVLLRGATDNARRVDLRAQTSGEVISEPLAKGSQVAPGDVICRLDPGTRKARLKEAEARREQARAQVPASEAQLIQAKAQVPAAQGALAQAQAALPAAEARVAEARARLNEAEISHNAAVKLAEGGFASKSRVANAEAALEAARAGLENARSGLEGARAQVENARAALEGARAGVKQAQSAIANAKAQVSSAEAAVAQAENEIAHLAITAPFAGVIDSDVAELGTLLQPGQACATLIDPDPIRLVGYVPELELARVKPGARAGGKLADGRTLVGKVTHVARDADPLTRTFRVEIEAPNPELAVRAGQSVEIGIEADSEPAHLLPLSALTLDDGGRMGVRIVAPGDVAGFVPVDLLRDTPEGAWVAGLAPQVDVIVEGKDYVTDGTPLAVTFKEPGA